MVLKLLYIPNHFHSSKFYYDNILFMGSFQFEWVSIQSCDIIRKSCMILYNWFIIGINNLIELIHTVPSSPTTPDGSKVPSPRQPTNLLGTFLIFSSIVLQNVKGQLFVPYRGKGRNPAFLSLSTCHDIFIFVDEQSVFHGRLCLIILTCIAEVR